MKSFPCVLSSNGQLQVLSIWSSLTQFTSLERDQTTLLWSKCTNTISEYLANTRGKGQWRVLRTRATGGYCTWIVPMTTLQYIFACRNWLIDWKDLKVRFAGWKINPIYKKNLTPLFRCNSYCYHEYLTLSTISFGQMNLRWILHRDFQ